jgi:two-component system, sensor histidine kinase RegB
MKQAISDMPGPAVTGAPLKVEAERAALPGVSRRRGRVSQRMLILHRWCAIIGQAVAVLIIHYGLSFSLPIVPAFLLIGASVVLNLIVMAQPRRPTRLDDRTTVAFLAFDIVQLSALLYLTGGLQNPFAVLMLAPVTVAATMLSRREVAIVAGLAILCLSVLALTYHPLPGPGDSEWVMPEIYLLGSWIALTLACLFSSIYVFLVEREARRMSDALTATQMALIREQKMSALGALAAAAAHELGSPLSTIRVIAKELAGEVPPDSEFAEDINLLLSESDRCRHILAELSRRPEPSSENPFDRMELPTIIQEVARPYLPPTVRLDIEIDSSATSTTPTTFFGPEIQHGLGNILQNAAQFASQRIIVRLRWDEHRVEVTIHDDGPGYPPQVIDQIGEPYVSGRVKRGESLGLGIFIAQTLLENTGAELQFGNHPRGGARVHISWPRRAFETRPPT